MTGPRLIRIGRAGDAPIPPAMRRVRGHAAGYLLAHHALSPAEAVIYTPPGKLDRWWLDRQVADGVVRVAAGGLWIDLAANLRTARRRGHLAYAIALPFILAAPLIAVLFY